MKILHVTPSFYPATYWGGPIWSTKAICDGIAAQESFDLRVLTTDSAGPSVADRVAPSALPYLVHYARRIAGQSIAPGLWARLPLSIYWADVVHLTGTYSAPTLPTLALARLIGRPVVWSPRGALQATAEWADVPRKRTKHWFEKAAQFLRPAQTVLHTTADAERDASVTRLPDIARVVIPNSVAVPATVPPPRAPDDRCRLIFLGRLHPKKGLDLLLDAMARLPTPFVLDIYGEGDAAYVAELAAKAAALAGRVRLCGPAYGEQKARALAEADLFVLPSHSENFGIAVAEALAHGTPVLTTTATPWSAINAHGCGRCVDLGKVDLAAEIGVLAESDLAAQGRIGRAWMAREFSQAAMVTAFAELYLSLGTERAATEVTA
ncbi:MAG: glycosyltransferase [Pseudomonadota bacterium]